MLVKITLIMFASISFETMIKSFFFGDFKIFNHSKCVYESLLNNIETEI
jgi:hypothetical protein